MITTVLGAPGSGKSTVAQPLAELLPGHAVVDWDAFMAPAAALAGREIRQNPHTWPAYRDLIPAVITSMAHLPIVLLGVCTPDELHDWPIDSWVLLDCADAERRERLVRSARPDDVHAAITDACTFRSLGLPLIDTTGRTPHQVAAEIALFVQQAEAGPSW